MKTPLDLGMEKIRGAVAAVTAEVAREVSGQVLDDCTSVQVITCQGELVGRGILDYVDGQPVIRLSSA